MNLFIAGICGTFMAGIAQLAKSYGHHVTGCDSNVYPPMSTLLKDEGINVLEGYHPEHISENVDQVIIGNALSRGNPLVESVLNSKVPFISGPQWLHDNLLYKKSVIAVSGTHGKTSTSSMIAWIMCFSGIEPGYLIGGKPGNLPRSAESGNDQWFVIEADEYDTAFFDKRSKFVHYSPNLALLNNLEFDHADIFDTLDQIKTQFHHLVRIVPSKGRIIANADDVNISEVLEMGCWTNITKFSIHTQGCEWYAVRMIEDCSEFEIFHEGVRVSGVTWNCIGQHNMQNALAAIVCCNYAGIDITTASEALASFKPSARRLQLLFSNDDLHLFEDFAHHPTAIETTIDAVKSRFQNETIIVVLEPKSNTMRKGSHGNALESSLASADRVYLYQSTDLEWDPATLNINGELYIHNNSQALLDDLELRTENNSVIICMSNGSFDGIPQRFREHLESNRV